MTFFDGNIVNTSLVSLLMIQMLFILGLPRLFHFIFRRIREPLVVSEIIAGIVLGPSVLGQIPNFSNIFFPSESINLLNAIAQLGLVLFLFMVGLNLDPKTVLKNVKRSCTASGLGFVFPFLISIGISFVFYSPQYTSTSFPVFVLFMALVYMITALAVLARILAEKKLTQTELGVMSLSTSALDTFAGWILMAIILALQSSGSGSVVSKLTPLWIFFLAVAQALILFFLVRPYFFQRVVEYVKKRDNLEPIPFFMVIMVLFVFAYFNETIGVSAVFGAFEVGLAVPRKGPFCRLMKQKLEGKIKRRNDFLNNIYFIFV